MGSCVSVHKNPESVMKIRMSFCGGGAKSDNFVVPSSPVKEKSFNVNRPIGADVAGFKAFPDFGSKEETFFDSQAWLESDCDDDFFSVNGDFTPSRGNTPKHYTFSPGPPRIDKPVSGYKTDDQKSESSPTEKKKRLSDLFFQDSDLDHDRHNAASTNTNTGTNTPFFSGASSVYASERTPNGGSKPDTNKLKSSVQCCIPRFLSSRGFDDNKKIMSPAHARG